MEVRKVTVASEVTGKLVEIPVEEGTPVVAGETVLARGYALVRRARDGAIVRTAGQLETGERLAIRVAEAELEASVEAVRALPKA